MISKRRIMGIASFILVAMILFFSLQQDANASKFKETNWTNVEMSMTDLLNDGWRLIGHSAHRAATIHVDTHSYTFILNRENKYIFCFIRDPESPQAETAGCRGLN
jgi:hypothetical protein